MAGDALFLGCMGNTSTRGAQKSCDKKPSTGKSPSRDSALPSTPSRLRLIPGNNLRPGAAGVARR